jgi:hypothetical protein
VNHYEVVIARWMLPVGSQRGEKEVSNISNHFGDSPYLMSGAKRRDSLNR